MKNDLIPEPETHISSKRSSRFEQQIISPNRYPEVEPQVIYQRIDRQSMPLKLDKQFAKHSMASQGVYVTSSDDKP